MWISSMDNLNHVDDRKRISNPLRGRRVARGCRTLHGEASSRPRGDSDKHSDKNNNDNNTTRGFRHVVFFVAF